MKTILVVDDNAAELQLLEVYLQRGGYAVESAAGGTEALLLASQHQPDAIVIDLVMPDMSGLELCRKLKRSPQTASIPIVACTSKDRNVDKNWARKQGVDLYLVKPCTESELVEAVGAAIASASS